MRIYCKNIGMIEEAKINLSGLTVIAGENDTGKSTLGKLLFAIIKSFDTSDVEEIFIDDKINIIRDHLSRAYFLARSNLDIDPDYTKTRLLLEVNSTISEEKKSEVKKEIMSDFMKTFDRSNKDIDNLTVKKLKKEYEKIAEKIVEKLAENIQKERVCRYKFSKYLDSLFDGEINNKYRDDKAKVVIEEGKSQVLNINIVNNQPCENYSFKELYIDEVTFLESPMVLQMTELINNARTVLDKKDKVGGLYRDQPIVNLHIKDLILKLRQPNAFDPEEVNITEIIDGNMDYDEDESSFYLKKGGHRFKAINIASGIKSFGIIQMLLKKGFLKERKLLILDEPEVNMHPKWQIEYARLLVKLVKETSAHVLITSHSPYFIEGIKVFSDKYCLSNKTNFYLTENNSNALDIKISDVTGDLSKVFVKLTEPFKELERITIGD